MKSVGLGAAAAASRPAMPRTAVWPASLQTLAVITVVATALAVVLGASLSSLAERAPRDVRQKAEAAQETLNRAEQHILAVRRAEGMESEAADGSARSSLLGNEWTPITTTTGNLEAKRIATDPRWAAALVLRMHEAGLRKGDVVAAGFSGSFPGLNLAAVAACQSLELRLVAVSSVTASSWGANQPGFTWPEIESRLVTAGIIHRSSVAISPGGAGDRALDLEPDGRATARRVALATAQASGIAFLEPADFNASVEQRFSAYREASRGRSVRLYINVGGTEPSLGRSARVLRQRSGFLPGIPFDFSPSRGMMARFAERGVPVLTLLNVRDLAVRWGIL